MAKTTTDTKVTCQPCGLTGPAQDSGKAAVELSKIHDQLIHGGHPTAGVTR